MITFMRSAESILLEFELMNSSPEKVLEVFRARQSDGKSDQPSFIDAEIEESLLSRSAPLVDLALAKYGKNPKVVRNLFERPMQVEPALKLELRNVAKCSTAPLRLSALSNEVISPYALFDHEVGSWGSMSYLQDFVRNSSDEELKVWLLNRKIEREVFANLYARGVPFENLDDEHWRDLIEFSLDSELLRAYSGPSVFGAEYEHDQVCRVAWSLPLKVPLENSWAITLRKLLSKVPTRSTVGIDVEALILRWRVSSDGLPSGGENLKVETHSQAPLLDEFGELRVVLAGEYSADNLYQIKDDEDVALRCAFYLRGQMKVEDLDVGFKRDGEVFIYRALQNQELWRNQSLRDALSRVSREYDSRGNLENWYQRRFDVLREHYEKLHPEWFLPVTPKMEGTLIAIEAASNEQKVQDSLEQIRVKLLTIQAVTACLAIGLLIVLAISIKNC